MPAFRAPRGTRDLLPPERVAFARLERIAGELTSRYGYRPIETPLAAARLWRIRSHA